MAMSKFVDYYRMLQVHHDAGQDIINAVYRHFSKPYHPDVNKSVLAIEKMKQINMAYDVIGDPRKRKAYHREWLRNERANKSRTFAPCGLPKSRG